MDDLIGIFDAAPVVPASGSAAAAAAPVDAGWEDILENWGQHAGSAEVRERILAGVPTSHLGRLWFTALAAASHGSSGGNMDVVGSDQDTATLFECAVQEAATLRERIEFDWDGSLRKEQPLVDDLAVVSADVPRTCPDLQRSGELKTADLQQVLDAFVLSSAETGGYSQGMADVAAWLLMHSVQRWQCFAVLRSLGSRPLLRSAMSLDMQCWEAIGAVFESHLGMMGVAPDLAVHFQTLGLQPFFFLPEWLVALWSRTLQPDAARFAWNMLLLDGDLFLITSCLGVARALAPSLLKCRDLAACRDALKTGPSTLSEAQFKEACLSIALHPSLLEPLSPWIDAADMPAMDEAMSDLPHAAPQQPPPPSSSGSSMLDDDMASLFVGLGPPPTSHVGAQNGATLLPAAGDGAQAMIPPPPPPPPKVYSSAEMPRLPSGFLDFLDKPR